MAKRTFKKSGTRDVGTLGSSLEIVGSNFKNVPLLPQEAFAAPPPQDGAGGTGKFNPPGHEGADYGTKEHLDSALFGDTTTSFDVGGRADPRGIGGNISIEGQLGTGKETVAEAQALADKEQDKVDALNELNQTGKDLAEAGQPGGMSQAALAWENYKGTSDPFIRTKLKDQSGKSHDIQLSKEAVDYYQKIKIDSGGGGPIIFDQTGSNKFTGKVSEVRAYFDPITGSFDAKTAAANKKRAEETIKPGDWDPLTMGPEPRDSRDRREWTTVYPMETESPLALQGHIPLTDSFGNIKWVSHAEVKNKKSEYYDMFHDSKGKFTWTGANALYKQTGGKGPQPGIYGQTALGDKTKSWSQKAPSFYALDPDGPYSRSDLVADLAAQKRDRQFAKIKREMLGEVRSLQGPNAGEKAMAVINAYKKSFMGTAYEKEFIDIQVKWSKQLGQSAKIKNTKGPVSSSSAFHNVGKGGTLGGLKLISWKDAKKAAPPNVFI